MLNQRLNENLKLRNRDRINHQKQRDQKLRRNRNLSNARCAVKSTKPATISKSTKRVTIQTKRTTNVTFACEILHDGNTSWSTSGCTKRRINSNARSVTKRTVLIGFCSSTSESRTVASVPSSAASVRKTLHVLLLFMCTFSQSIKRYGKRRSDVISVRDLLKAKPPSSGI
uniref:(northern house mosquito) hypothetical protein n=1 Tax=Culex pipiens TaxID=7175 RepID=A0A8D8CWV6_CULPI